jgi:serine/threonine-protein kinase
MELAEGVILDGHYRLRQLLGRGGMGEVWEASHTRLPKQFAVKFLLGLAKAEPELLMRFRREAEIASRLSHPSIVQVTDFNILPDGTAYIAMERLIGEDLRARLLRGPIPLDEARAITRQVASALELAHREGIVHRDLKPENIFLCREPDGLLRAKVLDFGISKLADGIGNPTRDDRVLGTPGYMAPEQAMGKNSSIDGRTDLFSLATIVYEMLTGKGVFMGDTLAELCTKVLYHTPPPLDELLPQIPRPFAVAISTALSKDPAQRQPEIRTFAEAIAGDTPITPDATSSTAPPSVSPEAPKDASSAPTRSRRPVGAISSRPRPSRAKPLTMALVIVVLLGVGAWLELRRAPPSSQQRSSASSRASDSRAPPPLPAQVGAGTADQGGAGIPAPSEPGVPLDAGGALLPERELRAQTKKAGPIPSASASHELDEAERALARGDAREALRLARNTLREGNSERAYFVMARAYCGLRDVGMIQAMLRNLTPALRKQVHKSCQTQGLPLP